MADKDVANRRFESLAKASLSVRYTRLINRQADSLTGTDPPISHPSSSALDTAGSPRPKLRTAVEPYSPPGLKGLLGLYQDRIRMLQSPPWLLEEQQKLLQKNEGNQAAGELIEAANFLLDLCRLLEMMAREIHQEESDSGEEESRREVELKLAAIWGDLYLAVENLKEDCKRSSALVRHAGMEVLNLGAELEGDASYSEYWRQKLLSKIEVLSAGIADAYELLSRVPARIGKRSKTIRNNLPSEASTARKGDGERQIRAPDDLHQTKAGLAHEVAVISQAVSALAEKVGTSHPDQSEAIGMLKLCAARLKSILSLSYSLKKWELELHRTHYIFRQAARRLPTAQPVDEQDKAVSPVSLPYGRMADYICDRFEDTIDRVFKESDSGYARHNFTVRKQSMPIASKGRLRPPITSLVVKHLAGSPLSAKPGLTSTETERAAHPTRQAVECTDADTGSNTAKGHSTSMQLGGNTGRDSVRERRLTRDARAQPQPGVRAVKMSVHWAEIQKMSEQQ